MELVSHFGLQPSLALGCILGGQLGQGKENNCPALKVLVQSRESILGYHQAEKTTKS